MADPAPGAPLDCHALAATHPSTPTTTVHQLLSPTLLVAGTNVVSVELHQAYPSQFTTAVFGGALTLTVFDAPVVTFAPVSHTWEYVWGDGLTVTAPTWFTFDYVESAEWSSGPGPLGVGDSQDATIFSSYVYATTAYFRTTIEVSGVVIPE